MSRGTHIKEIDEFPRRIKIFFIIIVCLLLIGTISFYITTGVSFEDSFFRTLQTLAFMFSEESTLIERLLEIFLAIVGVFLIWWVLWSVADMLIDNNLQKYLNTKINKFKVNNMKNHVIIVGGGKTGNELAQKLTKENKKFLIIENDKTAVKNLKRKKYILIEGNAEDDEVLIEAQIKNASKIILTLPNTTTNILITLTAKELQPNIEIYSRASEQKFVSKLKKAGATKVIVPEIATANKISELLK